MNSGTNSCLCQNFVFYDVFCLIADVANIKRPYLYKLSWHGYMQVSIREGLHSIVYCYSRWIIFLRTLLVIYNYPVIIYVG